MSKINFSKDRFSRFISSKGFYVAIVLCLAGAAAATWLAVDRTISGIEQSNSQILQNERDFATFPPAEEAEKKESGIVISKPESSAPPASSSAPVSEPEPASQPAVKSEQLPVQEQLSNLSYTLPIEGSVINQFSDGELIKNLTLGDWRTHDGIDFAADKNAEVYAVANGVVSSVKNDPLWGTVITIDHHDGNQSIYSGLSATVPVNEGDAVMGRQAIGSVDGVPCEISDESHLHFAMKREGVWIDPLSVLPR